MKILLINQSNGIAFNQNPPLGILYLASSLQSAGHKVFVYDQGALENNLKYPSFDYIRQINPTIVGFSLYTFGLPNTLQYIKDLKKAFPALCIVLGGHHSTALPERTMLDCPEADYLVYGEGLITIVELLKAIEDGTELSAVQGIYYRDINRNILSTPPRTYVKTLDEIPFPANELIQAYTYPSEHISKGKKILNMIASLGCPFHCAYCNKAVYGASYRRRSPQSVVNEIEYMFQRFNYDEVMFHDELFTANKTWMYELFGILNKKGLKFPWRCLGRVGTVTYEDLKIMRKNGCYIIAFGLESGNENVRIDIGRKMSDKDIRDTFDAAKQAGLVTYAFNMINHRLDTYNTIQDTYHLMCEVNASFAPVFICSPLPGSKLHGLLTEDIKYDWKRFNSYRVFGVYPISISAIPEKNLMIFANQIEAFYYSRLKYLYGNVFNKFAPLNIRIMSCRLWLGHLLSGRLKYLAKSDFLITGNTMSSIEKIFYKIIFRFVKGFIGLFKKSNLVKPLYNSLTQEL